MTTAPVLTITDDVLAELQARIETGGPAADYDETEALISHIRSLTERLERAEKDALWKQAAMDIHSDGLGLTMRWALEERVKQLSAVAQQPAPAAQEQVAWDVFYDDDDSLAHTVRTKREADRYAGMAYYVKPLYYAAPPAAEQPDAVKVPRELLEHIANALKKDRRWVEEGKLRALLGKEGE